MHCQQKCQSDDISRGWGISSGVRSLGKNKSNNTTCQGQRLRNFVVHTPPNLLITFIQLYNTFSCILPSSCSSPIGQGTGQNGQNTLPHGAQFANVLSHGICMCGNCIMLHRCAQIHPYNVNTRRKLPSTCPCTPPSKQPGRSCTPCSR